MDEKQHKYIYNNKKQKKHKKQMKNKTPETPLAATQHNTK